MTDRTPVFRKDHIFVDVGSGHAYKLNADVFSGEPIMAAQLVPMNGAPKPIPATPIPAWLHKLLVAA